MNIQVLDFSEANCKNCYKCVRACKVKAIKVKDNQARIEKDLCIECGQCFLVCSQNARKIHSDLPKVKIFLDNSEKVILSIAPSYKGYFQDSSKFIGLLKKMGFYKIEETGVAASYISKEYENYVTNCEKNIFLTSACASINSLIEKHYPQFIDYLIPVKTPLLLHGELLRNKYPDSKIVFLGPCLSKKTEVLSEDFEGLIDAVLTFDEIIDEYGNYNDIEPSKVDLEAPPRGELFPKIGGINDFLELQGYKKLSVQGLDESVAFFNSLDKLKDKKLFIEINACIGSCLGGPGGEKTNTSYFERMLNLETNLLDISNHEDTYKEANLNYKRDFYNKKPILKEVSEQEIQEVLFSMEKYSKADELNCAACGYNSCREKAIAVINGMSTIDMCIPFMRTKAERISNELFSNSPNGVFILDRNLVITDLNQAAKEKFYCDEKAIGRPISSYINDEDFQLVLESKKNIIKKRENYSNYNLIALKNIIYLENQEALLVIITNITKEEKQREELQSMKKSTLLLTQDVINKQMRVAQEIASLLGETTAETKVALTKLKHIVEGEF